MPEPEDSPEFLQAMEAMRRSTPPELHAVFEEAYRNQERIQRRFLARRARSQLEVARIVANHATTHYDPIRRALADVNSDVIFSDEQDLLYKHLFEDLTSALDYVAFELVELLGTPDLGESGFRLVSFPYRKPGQSDESFVSIFDRLLPGLRQSSPGLAARIGTLASEQYLEKPWLWIMAETVNRLKHRGFPSRRPGIAYSREGMRIVGNSMVAVQPTNLWDSVPDPSGGPLPFNLNEFAEQSIAFVLSMIEEFTSVLASVDSGIDQRSPVRPDQ
jgi:hypothetical protein